MAPVVGWLTVGLAASWIVFVWFGLRHKAPSWVSDVATAVGAAALGVGGLLVLEDPGTASWLLTPPALAFIAVVHRRLLFAGAGPLRT